MQEENTPVATPIEGKDTYTGWQFQPLFDLMSNNHGLTLLFDEMSEIMDTCRDIDRNTPSIETKEAGEHESEMHRFVYSTIAYTVASCELHENNAKIISEATEEILKQTTNLQAEIEVLKRKESEQFILLQDMRIQRDKFAQEVEELKAERVKDKLAFAEIMRVSGTSTLHYHIAEKALKTN